MKRYELLFDEETQAVNRVSVVKDAAVETTLLMFQNENEKPIFFANEEKRVIYAVAMRPNKMIYRKNVNGSEAEVYYSAETIEKLQQHYFRQNANRETNLNHEENNTDGVFPFESWIVKNPSNDKSNELGLETFAGDWVMAFKIDNDEVWNDCKEGKLDGLSVEWDRPKVVESNFKTEIKMTKAEKFYEAVKSLFSSDNLDEEKPKEEMAVELKSIETDDAKVFFEGATLNVGGNVYSDEQMTPLPAGEYPLENDLTLVVVEDGIVAELREKPAEEEMADEMPNVEDLQKENEQLKEEKAVLEKQLQDEKTAKVEAETELEKMKKETPKAVFVGNLPKVNKKSYEEMTNLEKAKFNRGKL